MRCVSAVAKCSLAVLERTAELPVSGGLVSWLDDKLHTWADFCAMS